MVIKQQQSMLKTSIEFNYSCKTHNEISKTANITNITNTIFNRKGDDTIVAIDISAISG